MPDTLVHRAWAARVHVSDWRVITDAVLISGPNLGPVGKVFIQAWEMQCCGELFSVGENVSWTTSEFRADPFLVSALGIDAALTITHMYEGHRDDDDNGFYGQTTGTVTAIEVVWCRRDDQPGVHFPIPESAVSERRQAIEDHWAAEDRGDGLSFEGYVITLE
jgi:hypothetical protein